MVNIMKITVCLRAAYLTGAGTDGWVCLGTGGRESSPEVSDTSAFETGSAVN